MIARAATDLNWLVERTGHPLSPYARGVEAVRPDGSVAGMVAYDFWTRNAVFAHMAVETPIAWRCLKPAALALAFSRVGVILGIISGDNTASLRAATHIGLRPVHRVPDGRADGIDLILLEMRKEDWQ